MWGLFWQLTWSLVNLRWPAGHAASHDKSLANAIPPVKPISINQVNQLSIKGNPHIKPMPFCLSSWLNLKTIRWCNCALMLWLWLLMLATRWRLSYSLLSIVQCVCLQCGHTDFLLESGVRGHPFRHQRAGWKLCSFWLCCRESGCSVTLVSRGQDQEHWHKIRSWQIFSFQLAIWIWFVRSACVQINTSAPDWSCNETMIVVMHTRNLYCQQDFMSGMCILHQIFLDLAKS